MTQAERECRIRGSMPVPAWIHHLRPEPPPNYVRGEGSGRPSLILAVGIAILCRTRENWPGTTADLDRGGRICRATRVLDYD
jgi:hypothetical protein